MKIVIKVPKARNPYVRLALNRKAGPHVKTRKAQRRSDKVKLRENVHRESGYLTEVYLTEIMVNFF